MTTRVPDTLVHLGLDELDPLAGAVQVGHDQRCPGHGVDHPAGQVEDALHHRRGEHLMRRPGVTIAPSRIATTRLA